MYLKFHFILMKVSLPLHFVCFLVFFSFCDDHISYLYIRKYRSWRW